MRDAVGEANLTVITIILIGMIFPVFYVIVPKILDSMQDRACCIQNDGIIDGSTCLIKKRIDADSLDCSKDDCYYEVNVSGLRNQCKK
ncbi:MAG: hypothetical protein J6D28_03405 [Bacilli bacterium]|nr:hypothetical protein [Bacilli bacterium]